MNICKRQTFIGKSIRHSTKKYLKILFYIASCIYEAYSCSLWEAATFSSIRQFEGRKYAF